MDSRIPGFRKRPDIHYPTGCGAGERNLLLLKVPVSAVRPAWYLIFLVAGYPADGITGKISIRCIPIVISIRCIPIVISIRCIPIVSSLSFVPEFAEPPKGQKTRVHFSLSPCGCRLTASTNKVRPKHSLKINS